MQQHYTEIVDVENIGRTTTIFVGREREYINPLDELTYVGDSTGSSLEGGQRYVFLGPRRYEPQDSVFLSPVDSEERVQVYNTDFRYYLLNGCFQLHNL